MAFGPGAAATEDDWTACAAAIAVAEVEARLPGGLLGAIARTESGRRDPATGRVEPWPWALNVEGAGFHAASRAEGLASIRAWRARGSRSIDVGCLQVNLLHHPAAFATLEEALDPLANARYAARFLAALQQRAGGDWGWPPRATIRRRRIGATPIGSGCRYSSPAGRCRRRRPAEPWRPAGRCRSSRRRPLPRHAFSGSPSRRPSPPGVACRGSSPLQAVVGHGSGRGSQI
ncbi:hypothetical protein ACFQY5_03880 [Paeniroseomonas aquatica]|uniref:hypothetical protein n=1 Tax=Paeniroseomonas aquatica TaxID=373043 RepID=UPI0036139B04